MTLSEWHHFVQETLSKAHFENPHLEAKWLLAAAIERDNSFIILNPTYLPTSEETNKIQDWMKRRLQGEPLSRLKGVREFWSLPFHLNSHTLDPRPETEVLVEGVLKWVGNKKSQPWRILDFGTGSGCLLISLLHELPQATGVGVDINAEALSMAQLNAKINHVDSRATFRQGNWGEGLESPFDIIVSNPPYIPLKDKKTLEKNVLDFDPSQALFGGQDGLDSYRSLIPEIKRLLAPQGVTAVEIGQGQRESVENLFHATGFRTLFVLKDLAGIERVLSGGFTHSS
jgi:release factor glutamine methyltransferase